MIKVGVTGGIGSGKTLVCQIIRSLGYRVYNADLAAKNLTNSDPRIVNELKKLFGDSIYINGFLDRKAVAEKVFKDVDLLKRLNNIVHPVVSEDFNKWLLEASTDNLVFKEAAILFESGAYKQLDKIVAVWAPIELRIKRVCNRDGVSPSEVEKRIKNQMDDKEINSRSDYIIQNSEFELLTPQVVAVVNSLLKICI